MELVGALDGVLPGHGVGDEQDFDRREQLFQLLQLDHQLFVDMQAAGGVDQQHVASAVDRFPARRPGQIDRLGLLRRARIDRQPDVLGDHAQLLTGGRTVDVDRNHHRVVAVLR